MDGVPIRVGQVGQATASPLHLPYAGPGRVGGPGTPTGPAQRSVGAVVGAVLGVPVLLLARPAPVSLVEHVAAGPTAGYAAVREGKAHQGEVVAVTAVAVPA